MNNNKIVDNLSEMYTEISNSGNCNISSHQSFNYVECFDSAWPNIIYPKSIDKVFTMAEVDDIFSYIKTRNIPKLLLLKQEAISNEMFQHLKELRFLPIGQWTNMALESINSSATYKVAGFDIETLQIDDESRLSNWIAIVSNVLFQNRKLDPRVFRDGIRNKYLKLFIGYYGGKPAATTLLFLGETAGIYMVATLPEFRKKGLGRAIMSATHTTAFGLDYNEIVLQSTNEGKPLYSSLGYKAYDSLALFYLLTK